MPDWKRIAQDLALRTGQPPREWLARPQGGGCINQAYTLESAKQRYFLKLNRADRLEMFAAEAEGLQELARAQAIKVPQPVCWGVAGGEAYLLMEHLELGGGRGDAAQLGRQLAALHRVTQAQFGWTRDNTIGATPQLNQPCADWVTFWREHRLGLQLSLAARAGYGGRLQRQGERLLAELGDFFCGYTPVPSLLHGDLWAGNYAFDRQGQPVIFDPAVYYGDREADLAMTELFGGFPAAFYAAYERAWPLDAGYRARKTLYNLYHILNHLNLFGGAYQGQAERMIGALLGELDIAAR